MREAAKRKRVVAHEKVLFGENLQQRWEVGSSHQPYVHRGRGPFLAGLKARFPGLEVRGFHVATRKAAKGLRSA